MAFQIGMPGLGRMGAEVGAKLASASRQVIAYISLARPYRTHSALDVTPAVRFENFANCFIVIGMLPDDDAVRGAIYRTNGLASRLQRGAIHRSMSTFAPTIIE